LLTALTLLVAALIWTAPASAGSGWRVTGGGTGTFHADLDADGDIDGSHFGVGAQILEAGVAKGHFECLMAGNADILGLPNMAVSGKVLAGVVNSPTSVTLSGVAKVILGNGMNFAGVPFEVTLTAGKAGEGTIQLHLMGGYLGGPGDFDLPVEEVATGQIVIH
jgi:hypothetical protein